MLCLIGAAPLAIRQAQTKARIGKKQAMNDLEHREQSALMRWAQLHEKRWPELETLHAVPNGGHRVKSVAVAMKAEGVKKGVLDLDLPVARGGYHGLRIEMKRDDKAARPTKEQRWWIERLREEGYRCEVCRGWEAARDVLIEYLERPRTEVVNGK